MASMHHYLSAISLSVAQHVCLVSLVTSNITPPDFDVLRYAACWEGWCYAQGSAKQHAA
jgi:hypothetical protein